LEPIIIDNDKCMKCGMCAVECPTEVIAEVADEVALQNAERCIFCGHCKAVCPEDAITIPSLNNHEFMAMSDSDVDIDPERLLNFFRFRRSIRQYKNRPVETEKLEKIIEAGRFSPTGSNLQHIGYVVVNTPEKMKYIGELTTNALVKYSERVERMIEEKASSGAALSAEDINQQNYAVGMRNIKTLFEQGTDRLTWNAPAMIIEHSPAHVYTGSVDAGMAGMQMTLMAQSMGLGTCYIGLIPMAMALSKELRTYLKLPPANHALVVFVLGYPDVSYQRVVARQPAKIEWF
jgi:nitroreductase/NAD-dependent dihydropyrimidine dehydrogenase PreA subunit